MGIPLAQAAPASEVTGTANNPTSAGQGGANQWKPPPILTTRPVDRSPVVP